jgi:hypothetical protein
MKRFEKNLMGYLSVISAGDVKFLILSDTICGESYKFLTEYQTHLNKTLTPTTFKTKITAGTKAYRDKNKQHEVILLDMVGKIVNLRVLIKHYSFVSYGEKIYGWNMHLIEVYGDC